LLFSSPYIIFEKSIFGILIVRSVTFDVKTMKRNYAIKYFVVILLLLVKVDFLYAANATIIFDSPSNVNKIIYIGEEYRGEGVFYLQKDDATKLEIIKTDIRYGPRINWFGDSFAEIYIPTGSPFSHSFLYDIKNNKLSGSIDNVLNVFPDENIVIYSDWECFIVDRINDEKNLQKIKIKGVTGSYLAIREHFKISTSIKEVIICIDFEPYTFKESKKMKCFKFKKNFDLTSRVQGSLLLAFQAP
jgi:hypothetical protein